MTKTKDLTYVNLLSSLFKFDIFTKKISAKLLIIYNLVLLLIISFLGIISNNLGNYPIFSNQKVFFTILFGLPIMVFVFFGIFYIFLNAYEIKRKKFYEVYLVCCSILFPFIVIGNIFNIIGLYTLNYFISRICVLLLILTVIYFLVNFIIHFKNYYNISGYKIAAVLLILFILNLALTAIIYTSYIVSIMNEYL